MPGAVEKCGIRQAVSIKVGPDKLADAGDSREGTNCCKCAVSVVAENSGKAGGLAKNNVEVAIGFDIDGPRAGVGSVKYGLWQRGLRRYVSKSSGAVLCYQAHAAHTSQHEIRLEIVVDVGGQDAFRRGRNG